MNTKRFALCGMLAPIVFALALAVFSLITPGYSNLTNMVSELGVIGAPTPWRGTPLDFSSWAR